MAYSRGHPPQGFPTPFHRYLRSMPLTHLRQTTSSAFGVIGRVSLATIDVPERTVVDRIIYAVGGVSAGNVRLCIYGPLAPVIGNLPDLPDGTPLVVETASVAQPGANTNPSVVIPDTELDRGLYAVGLQGSDVTGTFLRELDNIGIYGRRYLLGAFLAFTDPCPVTAAEQNVPVIILRVASP